MANRKSNVKSNRAKSRAPRSSSRAQATRAVQANDPRFHSIARSAGVIIVVVRNNFSVVEWNTEAERVFGSRRAKVLGKNYLEVCIPASDRQRVGHDLVKVAAGDPARSFEILWQTQGCDPRWVSWTATRLLNEDGTADGLVLVGQEITELKEKSARLDGIIRSAMDAIITIDEVQRVTLFNAAAERMFGCRAEDVVGQPIDRFIPERFRERHRQHIRGFGETHVTNRSMGRLGTIFGLRANGEEFALEASISQTETGGNKLFTVILRDLTERQRAMEALEESQRFMSTLMSNLPGMVYRCKNERDWPLEFVSQGCVALTGYQPEELLGGDGITFGRDLIMKEDRDRVWEEVQAALHLRQPFSLLYRIKTKHGDPKWVWEQGRGVFVSNDGLAAIEGYISDITERKRVEEQLRRTERLAELGVLASGLAHEIGTPMNVILGRAEYLLQRSENEGMRKGLDTIVRQVERITKIMNQLLAYARRRPAELRRMDLRRTVDETLEMIQEKITKHRIVVETDFDGAVSEIDGDPDQISQVLLNLLLNAVHAMEAGGVLRISARPRQGEVSLSVSDTGPGIPREHLAKIFEPFFTTKEVGKGTGLGLNVVTGIIQEHQGTITVESEPGSGTTFTITLPTSRTSTKS